MGCRTGSCYCCEEHQSLLHVHMSCARMQPASYPEVTAGNAVQCQSLAGHDTQCIGVMHTPAQEQLCQSSSQSQSSRLQHSVKQAIAVVGCGLHNLAHIRPRSRLCNLHCTYHWIPSNSNISRCCCQLVRTSTGICRQKNSSPTFPHL